jgi:hypothetical protein
MYFKKLLFTEKKGYVDKVGIERGSDVAQNYPSSDED